MFYSGKLVFLRLLNRLNVSSPAAAGPFSFRPKVLGLLNLPSLRSPSRISLQALREYSSKSSASIGMSSHFFLPKLTSHTGETGNSFRKLSKCSSDVANQTPLNCGRFVRFLRS